MIINANITGISYTPFLCKTLPMYQYNEPNQFETALDTESAFLLNFSENNNNIAAVSTWVSAKRTRSYPYARVYNTLGHSGKKITIIPFVKDEGADGDRDFLQWDTVSLMSLLDVYVIIAYYTRADKSKRYANKITNQRFDTAYIRDEIQKLLSYQSSALHWNIQQIDALGDVAKQAKDCIRL